MNLFRLCRAPYARDLTGTGARLYGGRWNPKGTAVLYAAPSRSLAVMEVLVHLAQDELPPDFVMVRITVPDDAPARRPAQADLPTGWRKYPYVAATQALGARFVREGRHALLVVPSAIVPEEALYVLNPAHPALAHLRVAEVKPFRFDPRLFARS